MKYIGYLLIATASFVLGENGFGVDTWQWWAITLCYISGVHLSMWEND